MLSLFFFIVRLCRLIFIFRFFSLKNKGKTSNSTKIVCEIANSLQKKVVHQDSNLTQKFGLRRVFCFLAYQAGRVQGWLASAKFLAGRKPPQLGAPPPKGGGEPLIKARLFRTKSNLKKQICN